MPLMSFEVQQLWWDEGHNEGSIRVQQAFLKDRCATVYVVGARSTVSFGILCQTGCLKALLDLA